MISLLGGLFIFVILGVIALIELFIEVLCIVIGIPLFMIFGIISLCSWFFEKLKKSFDDI